MTIENTTKRDPLVHLVGAFGEGSSGYIEGMEAAGQRQLVNSDRLPTDCRDREALEALGFTFGEPDPADPMFMPATLPEGWSRKGSDHAMWSHIVDERGIERVAIFYKAAFYDRSAHMSLARVGSSLASGALYNDGFVIPWAVLTDDEAAECVAYVEKQIESEFRYYDDPEARMKRARAVLASRPS